VGEPGGAWGVGGGREARVDNGDWAVYDGRALVGGHRLVRQVEVDPFLTRSGLIDQVLRAIGDGALLPFGLDRCRLEGAQPEPLITHHTP